MMRTGPVCVVEREAVCDRRDRSRGPHSRRRWSSPPLVKLRREGESAMPQHLCELEFPRGDELPRLHKHARAKEKS